MLLASFISPKLESLKEYINILMLAVPCRKIGAYITIISGFNLFNHYIIKLLRFLRKAVLSFV